MLDERRLEWSLFLLRITVFIVVLVWTVDKFLNPGHAAKVYESFYYIGGLGAGVMTVIGVVELVILVGFALGLYKKYTYGAVLIFHGISTLSTWKMFVAPLTGAHMLFFAGLPMLAACLTLFLLREQDKLFVVSKK